MPIQSFDLFSLESCLIAVIFLVVDACTGTGTASLPCSCSPFVYNWTLALFNECPVATPENGGIGKNSFCKINTASLDPVVIVNEITFYEYDVDLGKLVTFSPISGYWTDRDTRVLRPLERMH